MYFVISNDDGDTSVEQLSEEELLERLDPEDPYYGGKYGIKFLKEIVDYDTNYWGDNILIIKGKIIVPKKKEIVTKYVLEE